MNIKKSVQSALEHYRNGNLKQAESVCRQILKERPNDPELLHFLGIVYMQSQKYDLAIECIEKSLRFNPSNADAHLALGIVSENKGMINEALAHYRKATELNPNSDEAHNRLGHIYGGQGLFEDALNSYRKAIQINPGLVEAHVNMGNVLRELGRLDDAIIYYQNALRSDPNLAETYNNLGAVFVDKGLPDEAIMHYQRAIELAPGFAEAYRNLGHVLRKQGRQAEAISAFDKVSSLDPRDFEARLARCISQLPVIYRAQTDIQIARDRFQNELLKLHSFVSLDNPRDVVSAAAAVGSQQPFFLPYQGLNDRELQKLYGNLVHKIMSVRYPEFITSDMPPHLPGQPLRVGFVSGFFNLHSNWKIPIKGWVENMDRKRFRLYGYYTGKKKDIATAEARRSFDRFIEDVYPFERLCEIIKGDKLHMLIYPEIGMWSATARLAALRLAPIQCNSWGHPDTSGLPSMDYFLSSELMEPPGADEHYTEKLVRLPNLSIHYTPLDIPASQAGRVDFGLRPAAVLYLCCQSLYKYLPQYDEIYPRIADAVGDCQFVFIANESGYVTEQLRRRLRKVFDESGMNVEDYVVILPRLDGGRFEAINALSDIYLDSIGWSGCNSTLEALAHNLPVVTLPGDLMRGRHSKAILTMMGITETIASSVGEYVSMAVRLGLDRGKREDVAQRVAANKHLAYRDKTCVTAIEEFIEKAVAGSFETRQS